VISIVILTIFWTNYDFLSEKNRFLRKKNFRRSAVWRDFMAVQMKIFVLSLFERCFQVRDFSFWITKEIGLSGSCLTNFWLLFHFHVKYWAILMFLGLIWCKIFCWAQKSIPYALPYTKVQSKAMRAQKRNLLVMNWINSCDLSIRNFMLSSKKYNLRGLKLNRKSWEPKNVIFKWVKKIYLV
jgi:hypothetical protein